MRPPQPALGAFCIMTLFRCSFSPAAPAFGKGEICREEERETSKAAAALAEGGFLKSRRQKAIRAEGRGESEELSANQRGAPGFDNNIE